jgi:ubiquinone/menaquinone biosynthesis C-methylase UbiE
MMPSTAAWRLVSGYRGYQLIAAACQLNLPDLLAAGPKSADELAAQTDTHASSLHRMLRGLAAWAVFVELPDGRFASTKLSDQFRSDRPGLRNTAIMNSDDGYRAWGDLLYTLHTGKPAFDHVFGKGRFEELGENPAAAERFNAAMVEVSTRVAKAFIAAYDFGGARTVVDVGGGNGGLVVAVLQAHPRMRGVLFDLAQGLNGARERMESAGVADRMTLVEGSFFETVPAGGDVYLLKSIVHDWDDERGLAILHACRRAMSPEAKLLVVERELPERIENPDEALSTVMSDLHMMVVLGGRERTINQYRDFLNQAGLRMTRSIPTDSEFVAIEAVVAR